MTSVTVRGESLAEQVRTAQCRVAVHGGGDVRLAGSSSGYAAEVAVTFPFADIGNMASRLFDFSHLTPDERIELAEQLWDSLSIDSIVPDDEQIAELRRRRAELQSDGKPGRPWRDVLDELNGGGG